MAGCTLFWRRRIEENHFRFDWLHQLVAAFATHISVDALQGELRALVMVEQ